MPQRCASRGIVTADPGNVSSTARASCPGILPKERGQHQLPWRFILVIGRPILDVRTALRLAAAHLMKLGHKRRLLFIEKPYGFADPLGTNVPRDGNIHWAEHCQASCPPSVQRATASDGSLLTWALKLQPPWSLSGCSRPVALLPMGSSMGIQGRQIELYKHFKPRPLRYREPGKESAPEYT